MKYLSKLCVLLILSSLCQFSLAAKLYKYQDDQGNWHFTDKKPSAIKGVEEIRIKARNEKRLFKDVWVRENTGTSPSLTVVNNYHGPIQATLTIQCTKCKALPASEVTVLVEGDSEALAFNISPDSPTWEADYEISISIGNPDAKHDDKAVYGLPVPMDEFFLVTQGFNGQFSHSDDYNKYAIDIAMNIGTPVVAARDGIVMAIEEGYKTAGVHQDFADKANVVYILHDDGTIAIYAHLDMHSSYVQPGDRVDRGQPIARSGNTGFSTGPHLHFNVQKNSADGEKSIPILFDKGKGQTFIPTAGEEVKWDIYSRVETRVSEKNRQLYDFTVAQQKEAAPEETSTEKVKSVLKGFLDKAKSYLDEALKEDE